MLPLYYIFIDSIFGRSDYKFNGKPERSGRRGMEYNMLARKMHPQITRKFICFYYVSLSLSVLYFIFFSVKLLCWLSFFTSATGNRTLSSACKSEIHKPLKALKELNWKKSQSTLWTWRPACEQFLTRITRFKWNLFLSASPILRQWMNIISTYRL